MINTKILLSVVIVLLIGVAAAGYQINNKNISSLWQPSTATTGTTTTQSQDTSQGSSASSSGLASSSGKEQTTGTEVYSSSGTSKTGGSTVISSSAAKTAAQNVIDVAGATAGTPKLSSDGTYYTVPIMENGKQTGYIDVNAKTGAIIEGAGSSDKGVA